MGLEPDGYILALGRLSREKGFHDLTEAYRRAGGPRHETCDCRKCDSPTPYSRQLHDLAHRAGAIMVGEVHGEKLRQLMGGAALFVLPSYHEGLSISLLEAMAMRSPDSPERHPRQPPLRSAPRQLLPPGDPAAMARAMTATLTLPSPAPTTSLPTSGTVSRPRLSPSINEFFDRGYNARKHGYLPRYNLKVFLQFMS